VGFWPFLKIKVATKNDQNYTKSGAKMAKNKLFRAFLRV
jgi:hypothetical protein